MQAQSAGAAKAVSVQPSSQGSQAGRASYLLFLSAAATAYLRRSTGIDCPVDCSRGLGDGGSLKVVVSYMNFKAACKHVHTLCTMQGLLLAEESENRKNICRSAYLTDYHSDTIF